MAEPGDTRRGVAVVGGGAGALGRAVVERLLDGGWPVVVPVRRPQDAELPAGAVMIACDLRVTAEIEALAAAVAGIGPWRAVVNASGGYAGGEAHRIDDEEMLDQLELNFLGPWRLARAAARAMIAQASGGRIVNVASRSAVDVAPGQAGYQVAKAALVRLTEVMALELREHGITVNAVMPSIMDTPANRFAMPHAEHARWPHPGEVAAAIEWLLGDDAGVVSGAVVPAFGRA
ncbi:MAG TPA: SDR family oxidoreductase [Candidatus Angelobacter sp.]|jgi:NAD(P)-dependent dehydrogenase (short-subunit alcohol dehydrogenase family)|nr:SDR family oxidoreductase [Candidatus Angelobacter sp.]